jgi:N-acetylneuraminate lyase
LSVEEARALAAHAQEIGAFAIGTVAPCYFKPKTVDDLVAFCARLAEAAPDLPFYFYHIPALTGVRLSIIEFLETGADRIPTLAGIKYTDEDLMEFGRCLRLRDGRFDMLYGRDELMLCALALGSRGFIGSTYNFMAPVYLRLIEAFRAGDLERARAEQARANSVIELLHKYGGLGMGKETMRRIGVDCGPVRLPARDLDEEQRTRLHAELDRLDFSEFCSKLPDE